MNVPFPLPDWSVIDEKSAMAESFKPGVNLIVSAPGLAFAESTAARREPMPASSVLYTINGFPAKAETTADTGPICPAESTAEIL